MRRLLALLVVAASAGASAGAPDDGPGDAVVAAIRAAGGYVDHRQEIVELAPGYRGVVARRAIDAGAVLARIPWSGLLAAEGTCPLALALADKLRAEDAADPLAAYLKSLEAYDPALPDAWSSLANVAKLPPRDWRRHSAWFDAKCRPGGAADGADDRALHLVVGRAGAGQGVHFMAPLYDLYNHRNGRHHNTRVHVDAGVEVKVVAHRDIAAGEELYNSYGRSAPDMFRDYGFVEADPQTWDLVPDFPFEVDGGKVHWSTGRPSLAAFHGATADVLRALASGVAEGPEREVAAARAYRGALLAAIHAAKADLMASRAPPPREPPRPREPPADAKPARPRPLRRGELGEEL